MDPNTMLQELDEMIATIESLVEIPHAGPQRMLAKGALSTEVAKARRARLWWLRRVRSALLARRPYGSLLH